MACPIEFEMGLIMNEWLNGGCRGVWSLNIIVFLYFSHEQDPGEDVIGCSFIIHN